MTLNEPYFEDLAIVHFERYQPVRQNDWISFVDSSKSSTILSSRRLMNWHSIMALPDGQVAAALPPNKRG